MEAKSAFRAIVRARKHLAHATRQHAEAETEKSRRRHDRRINFARRHLIEAEREFSLIALTDAD